MAVSQLPSYLNRGVFLFALPVSHQKLTRARLQVASFYVTFIDIAATPGNNSASSLNNPPEHLLQLSVWIAP